MDYFPWPYSDLSWMVTLIISTGWMMQVANIPLKPPIRKGWIESRNLSMEDLAGLGDVITVIRFYVIYINR